MRDSKGKRAPYANLYALLAPCDTESDPDESQLLWRRVIVQAAQDALNNIQTKSMKFRLQVEKKRSLEWLTENGRDYRMVCDYAGVDAERTRRNITQFLTHQKGARIMAKAKTKEETPSAPENDNKAQDEAQEAAEVAELEHHIIVPESLLFHLDTRSVHDALRDAILDFFKSPNVKRWSERSESEQRSLATEISCAVKKMIAQTAQVVATHGFTCLPGSVEQITVKKGIKLVIEAGLTPKNFEAAGQLQGRYVTILNTSFDDFTKTLQEAVLDKDQPSLPLSGGQQQSVAEAAQAAIDAEKQAEVEGQYVGDEEPA